MRSGSTTSLCRTCPSVQVRKAVYKVLHVRKCCVYCTCAIKCDNPPGRYLFHRPFIHTRLYVCVSQPPPAPFAALCDGHWDDPNLRPIQIAHAIADNKTLVAIFKDESLPYDIRAVTARLLMEMFLETPGALTVVHDEKVTCYSFFSWFIPLPFFFSFSPFFSSPSLFLCCDHMWTVVARWHLFSHAHSTLPSALAMPQ